MSKIFKLLILPGDGIGPEVMAEVKKLILAVEQSSGIKFEITYDDIGGAAYDRYGYPLADTTLEIAKQSHAVLLGAVGGEKWDDLDFSLKPEQGLLRIRKELELFANLRPAMCFESMVEASSLKPELVAGLDIMIVRELTGGIYFGEPRGIQTLDDGTRQGVNTQTYNTKEIHRVARIAFELARKRDNRVMSSEKSNVMESGILWREEVTKIHAEEYSDVELTHMYADNCAMQLVRNPKQFDVIVTDNLFGDILSDEASMLTGSLGMLPSASLGEIDENNFRKALYEPVHGSAPDIAGEGIANPIACILSFAMCLKYSFAMDSEAEKINEAVNNVLTAGFKTKDLIGNNEQNLSTQQMGDKIVEAYNNLVSK
jgi:3-isopropylmalate dehydrogenase